MVAGGVDAPLAPGILAGFNLLTVLTTDWNDEPERASRPFTRNRSGMVLGEGAWIYVLEEFERAKKRGVRIYAEIAGYGSTCDAYHRECIKARAEQQFTSRADVGNEIAGWPSARREWRSRIRRGVVRDANQNYPANN